jgi:hypothetical protein
MLNCNFLKLIRYTNMEQVHITEIRSGDAIMHNGELKTVCNRTLKYSSFMGVTLFGDSYNLGYKKVTRVHANRR